MQSKGTEMDLLYQALDETLDQFLSVRRRGDWTSGSRSLALRQTASNLWTSDVPWWSRSCAVPGRFPAGWLRM